MKDLEKMLDDLIESAKETQQPIIDRLLAFNKRLSEDNERLRKENAHMKELRNNT